MKADFGMRECEECERLGAEYDRLNQAYLAALEAAEVPHGGLAKEFLRLTIISNDAWLEAEIARLELERHIEQHRPGTEMQSYATGENPARQPKGRAIRRVVACPRCSCLDLKASRWGSWERFMVMLTGKMKYRCKRCGELFRAPDRRTTKRDGDALTGARAAGILRW